MDDGYKSELKAAIVASPNFLSVANVENPTDIQAATKNLSYAILDFVIVSVDEDRAKKWPFERVLDSVDLTYHKMMAVILEKGYF